MIDKDIVKNGAVMTLVEKYIFIRRRAKLYLKLRSVNKKKEIAPVVSNLFITEHCNIQCNYCYSVDNSIKKSEELTTQQWLDLISELYKKGTRLFNIIGGEPVLRKDLSQIIEYILSKDVICDVNTNLMLVKNDSPFLKTLSQATQIFSSIDGREAAHDLNRGHGSFKKTIQGLMAVRRIGLPVRINCTVTRHNIDDIDYLIDLANTWNFFLTFSPLVRPRIYLREKMTELTLSEEEARTFFKKVKEAKKKTGRIMNSDAALDYMINYPVDFDKIVYRTDSSGHSKYYNMPCPYGRTQFFFDSKGNVYPCQNMWNSSEFSPKNVIKHGVGRAIDNASRLSCKFCSFGNLVEWNKFTTFSWLKNGIKMTMKQLS